MNKFVPYNFLAGQSVQHWYRPEEGAHQVKPTLLFLYQEIALNIALMV